MADVSTALKWGPGFVGMSIGLAMYGVLVRQFLFYTMAFPRDKRLVNYTCTLQPSWDLSTNLVSRFMVSFLVQCFYAHRVWMICGRSKLLTSIVLFVALAALVFGVCTCLTCPSFDDL
ncbi:hypothetical protein PISMIDRAFT_406131 [Pisolithus microcarpus 441]|uniref:Uncharacterized protein n=1 Tax=Pisolithus microcarpus 441 TaxID=765257 RepID=A0A0C9YSP3_9AGAM|nr:hypothetical protein PISMIDRAFT_406131 [Pisolithus microcarpus 441]